MKFKPLSLLLLLFSAILISLPACKEFIEPSITKSKVYLEAPANNYQSSKYAVNFWWDEVDDALYYHLQIVTPNFDTIGSLILDSVVSSNKFTFNLDPGKYQWRVRAENGSSFTQFSENRNLLVLSSSIKQQSVQLVSPSNGSSTTNASVTFKWGSLFGATMYRIEVDTNNFLDTSKLVYKQVLQGQQVNIKLPKNQVYQWRVQALNDTATALYSQINSFTYQSAPPAQVIVISPANGATVPSPVQLTWNGSSGLKYKLYVFKSDSTTLYDATFPMLLSSPSYNFLLGNSLERIYWKVSAVDAAGNEGKASVLRNFVLQ